PHLEAIQRRRILETAQHTVERHALSRAYRRVSLHLKCALPQIWPPGSWRIVYLTVDHLERSHHIDLRQRVGEQPRDSGEPPLKGQASKSYERVPYLRA